MLLKENSSLYSLSEETLSSQKWIWIPDGFQTNNLITPFEVSNQTGGKNSKTTDIIDKFDKYTFNSVAQNKESF